MDRAKLLALIDVANQPGLEIGALDKPMITRAMGPVEYIDRASREDLRREYSGGHRVDLDALVEVDHIWGAQTLFDCVGRRRAYAYLLASHVIEHVPDMFGWLREIAEVLVDGGVAAFVVPDKRFTFDMQRRNTNGADLVDAHVRGLRRPDVRQIFDNFHYFRDPATGADHSGSLPTDDGVTTHARAILALCRRVHELDEYVDAHCWVFTPPSILEGLDLGSRLGLLPYEIAALEPTAPGDGEFLLALRRLPDDLDADAQRHAFTASVARLNLPEENAAHDPEMLRLAAEADHAKARLAAIEASSSWRLTRPIRMLVSLARGLRPR